MQAINAQVFPFWAFMLLYLLVVIGPVVFWLLFFKRQDRAEPEPQKLLFRLVLWGIISAFVAVIFESLIFNFIAGGEYETVLEDIDDLTYSSGAESASIPFLAYAVYFLAGPIEELVKFLILRIVVFNRISFNQIADGAIYGISLALGFTIAENTVYFLDFYYNATTGFLITASVMRAIVTVVIHIWCTGLMGYYLGKAKFYAKKGNEGSFLWKGLLFAFLIHGFYNIAVISPVFFILTFIAVFGGFFWFIRMLKKQESQMVWRLRLPNTNNNLTNLKN